MRPLQQTHARNVLGMAERALHLDGVLPLQAQRSGALLVEAGQVWITRSGDCDDHVLGAGTTMALGRGERLVAEPWRSGQVVQLRWLVDASAVTQAPVLRPLASALPPARAGRAWRVLAWALRGTAQRLAAAARNADSRASTAQGRICAGDSMASAGALQ